MLLIMLIVTAPISIAFSILPITQPIAKLARDEFIGLLVVGPMAALAFATGRVMGIISINSGGEIGQFIGIVFIVAPCLLILVLVQRAGRFMGVATGVLNKGHQSLQARLSSARSNAAQQNVAKMKAGNRFSDRNIVTHGINRATAGIGTGWQGRFGVGRRGQAAVDHVRRNAAANQVMKSEGWLAITEDDEALRAATYDSAGIARTELYNRNLANLQKDVTSGKMTVTQAEAKASSDAKRAVAAAQTSIGFGRPQAIAAAQQLATTGTGYANLEEEVETIVRSSNGDTSTASAIAGYNNFINKQKGRYDLAPGAGQLAGLATDHIRGATPGVDAYEAARVQGARSADTVTLLRGKKQEVEGLTTSLASHASNQFVRMTNARASGQTAIADEAQREFIKTMGQVDQLKQSKSYASPENQDLVNRLDDTVEQWGYYGQLANMTGANGTPGPITREQAEAKKLYDQVRAPRINPNDPNNIP
jgi:hypothetical protein